jgi:hypothetical protein
VGHGSDALIDWRRARAHATWALLLAGLLCGGGWAFFAGTASTSAAAPDPAVNLQIGPLPLPCYAAPVSPACELPIVGYLDAARHAVGLGPYELPSDFATLPADRQLFILVNLDRRAYSLPLISGLSPQLDDAAASGASIEQDPAAPSSDRAIWASAWAAGLVNVLEAYYQWMYSDGFPGLNIDCPTPAVAGCWVHRHGVLYAFPPSEKLTMGAASATGRDGRAVVGMLIAATPRATGPVEDYSWADAEADGAGRGPVSTDAVSGRAPTPVRPRITRSRVRSSAGTASFYFSGRTGDRFECTLRLEATARHYAACLAPARYTRLRPGTYDFSVRAFSSATHHSMPVERRITIA